MPKITDIKQQQRNRGRYYLYLDGKYSLSLSELDLLAAGLQQGMDMPEAEIQNLRQQGEVSKAYDRALGYLSFRARSEHEIRKYLHGKEYSDEVITAVVARLLAMKLLDDAEFARSWIRNRQTLRPRSKRILQAELTQKGIAPWVISTVLGEMGEDDQLNAVRALILKRAARYDSRDKLMAYLARQGFSYDLIKKAFETVDEKDI